MQIVYSFSEFGVFAFRRMSTERKRSRQNVRPFPSLFFRFLSFFDFRPLSPPFEYAFVAIGESGFPDIFEGD